MAKILYPKARSENLVVQTLLDETLIYDITTNEAHCLNETAAFIWDKCSGDVSIGEIARSASAAFGHPVNADLVNYAVKELNDRRLLHKIAGDLPMLTSRREAIKRIGLLSAVALPVIASLVAPRNALSAINCACTSPLQCQSRTNCPSTTTCNANGTCSP